MNDRNTEGNQEIAIKRLKSISQPAVRMVVLSAAVWKNSDGSVAVFRDIIPVVGVAVKDISVWGKYTSERQARSDESYQTSPERLRKNGWHCLRRCNVLVALIVDEEFGEVMEYDGNEMEYERRHVAAAPWGSDEDEKRFKGKLDELEEEARRSLEWHNRQVTNEEVSQP